MKIVRRHWHYTHEFLVMGAQSLPISVRNTDMNTNNIGVPEHRKWILFMNNNNNKQMIAF